jgi:hypothetical protein
MQPFREPRKTDFYVSIFADSKSPGLLSIADLQRRDAGGQAPAPVTGFIRETVKSPPADAGDHSPRRWKLTS